MPYRAMNAVVGVVGVVVLAALVALGVNVYRSARTGPRWKRGLIVAGLVMLGLVGTTSSVACCYQPVMVQEPYRGQDLDAVGNSLDFLEKQIANGGIQLDAARSTLSNIEANLQRAAIEEQLRSMPVAERETLTERKQRLQERIEALRRQIE